eukprot:9282250-Ditylum_brightwellii.AAC.1
MATLHRSLYDKLKQYFDGHFNYTTYESNVIRCINTRIIIRNYGISLDIPDNIIINVLHDDWSSHKAPFQSSPFPLKNTFELELFTASPLIGKT